MKYIKPINEFLSFFKKKDSEDQNDEILLRLKKLFRSATLHVTNGVKRYEIFSKDVHRIYRIIIEKIDNILLQVEKYNDKTKKMDTEKINFKNVDAIIDHLVKLEENTDEPKYNSSTWKGGTSGFIH